MAKILFVHHGADIGGAPKSLLYLIRSLGPGYETKVLFIRDSPVVDLFKAESIAYEVINGNTNWFLHNINGKKSIFCFHDYIKVYKDWKRQYHEALNVLRTHMDFDVVHLNSHVLTSWSAAAKYLGFKVVLHNREAVAEGYFGLRKWILTNLIENSCDAVINISIDNERRLGLRNKSHVIYNPVEIPQKFFIPGKNRVFRILYISGMNKIKGFGTMVNSLKYLDENIEVLFAGHYGSMDAPNHPLDFLKNIVKLTYYRAYYEPLRILRKSNNASILGILKDPYTEIDRCDILVSPFRVPHFSRPAIEAFSYGKPVIGSDVDGMDEIIDHNVNGFIFKNGDSKDLANRINQMCSDPDLLSTLGGNARQKATQLYSSDYSAKKMEQIYDDIVSVNGYKTS